MTVRLSEILALAPPLSFFEIKTSSGFSRCLGAVAASAAVAERGASYSAALPRSSPARCRAAAAAAAFTQAGESRPRRAASAAAAPSPAPTASTIPSRMMLMIGAL